jgi:hypothetical protein
METKKPDNVFYTPEEQDIMLMLLIPLVVRL